MHSDRHECFEPFEQKAKARRQKSQKRESGEEIGRRGKLEGESKENRGKEKYFPATSWRQARKKSNKHPHFINFDSSDALTSET